MVSGVSIQDQLDPILLGKWQETAQQKVTTAESCSPHGCQKAETGRERQA
jgi:hypothetical protein